MTSSMPNSWCRCGKLLAWLHCLTVLYTQVRFHLAKSKRTVNRKRFRPNSACSKGNNPLLLQLILQLTTFKLKLCHHTRDSEERGAHSANILLGCKPSGRLVSLQKSFNSYPESYSNHTLLCYWRSCHKITFQERNTKHVQTVYYYL